MLVLSLWIRAADILGHRFNWELGWRMESEKVTGVSVLKIVKKQTSGGEKVAADEATAEINWFENETETDE